LTSNLRWHGSHISHDDRCQLLRQRPLTIWFTGLSGAGKSTLAFELERRLVASGRTAYVLDGDNIRHGLCADLGFSAEARAENIRRVAEVAKLFNDAGMLSI
jgi:adenylylsulfate kinase